jgi:O-antigen/teichoic acid export membrane protein
VGIEGAILSRLRRGAIEAFVLHAVGFGLLFAMHTALGREVGPRGYGMFSYAFALSSLLAALVPLGWPTALMRFVAQYVEQQEWGLLRGALRRSYQITFLSAAVATVALLGISYLNLVSPDLNTSLRFSAVLLPLLAFVGLRRRALQGLRRIKSSIVPEEIVIPLLVLVGLYLLNVSSALGALLLYTGAVVCSFFLGNFLLLRSLPEEERAAKPEYATRAWMAVTLPMLLGGLGTVIMNRTDVIVLGALLDAQSVGLYSAALRFAMLNTFLMTVVNIVVPQAVAAAFHGGRFGQTRAIVKWATLISVAGALPLFLVMLLFPGFLLGFFGQEFTEADGLLRVLAFGQFVNAATGPIGQALLMTGRQRIFAWTTGTMAICNVIGNLLLVPLYGAVGSAWVTAACTVAMNLILFYFFWSRTPDR